jgi:hypothetical protein
VRPDRRDRRRGLAARLEDVEVVAWPSGAVYDEMRLQLAAYSRAEFIAKVADPERYPLPAIERFGILHVTDGGTRLYEADVTENDWIDVPRLPVDPRLAEGQGRGVMERAVDQSRALPVASLPGCSISPRRRDRRAGDRPRPVRSAFLVFNGETQRIRRRRSS